jgi:hypothetical protein
MTASASAHGENSALKYTVLGFARAGMACSVAFFFFPLAPFLFLLGIVAAFSSAATPISLFRTVRPEEIDG